MSGYEALMREVAEREVERWPNDQAFSLLPRMHTIAVEVILQALLGVAQGSYRERLRDSVRELLDRYTETRTVAALFILGPALTLRVTALGELLRRVDEALYAEMRVDATIAIARGVRMSSPCCSRPASRTARRCPTRTCAISSCP